MIEKLFEHLPNGISIPAAAMKRIMKGTKFANDVFPKRTLAVFYVRRVKTSEFGWLFHAGYSDGTYLGHRTNVYADTLAEALDKLIVRLGELGIKETWHSWHTGETFLTDRQ